ncbi:MAG: glycosyltransferase [Candidatus Pacebacteria bacterium]|nr:glycosyltransferase [Candidatus Paceibacterota bacterium]
MKILILAPLTRKMSPDVTAARPRLTFDFIKGLQKRGHKITVLGTKDSKIPGIKIIPVIDKGIYELTANFENPFYTQTSFLVRMAKKAEELSKNFDIIHNHSYPEFINLLPSNYKAPIVTTIRMAMTPFLDETLSHFSFCCYICPSFAGRKLFKKTKIYKVIHHGIDHNLYKFQEKKQDYLLWIGRLGKAKNKKGIFIDGKGVREAIQLARKTDSKLLLSGNVEDIDFYNQDVRPYLSDKIKWIGKISFEQPLSKNKVVKLMQGAKAFLMTTKLEEAFGLVAAEAQSCGTPVIAFRKGAIPDIIQNNKTGFVVSYSKGINGLIKALKKIDQINPQDCRKNVLENFTLEKMVENYEKLYYELIKK